MEHLSCTQHALFLGSLRPETSEGDLMDYFSGFGHITRTKVIYDVVSRKSKCCGIVFCGNPETMLNILNRIDHFVLGKKVRVTKADIGKKGTKKINTKTLMVKFPTCNILHLGKIVAFFAAFGIIERVEVIQNSNYWVKEETVLLHYSDSAAISSATKSLDPHLIEGIPVECSPVENPENIGIEEVSSMMHSQIAQMSLATEYPPGFWLTSPSAISISPPSMSLEEISDSMVSKNQLHSKTPHQSLSDETWAVLTTSTAEATRPTKKEAKKSPTYVHIVEMEADELYRIFCPPKIQKRQSICNSQLTGKQETLPFRKTSSTTQLKSEVNTLHKTLHHY